MVEIIEHCSYKTGIMFPKRCSDKNVERFEIKKKLVAKYVVTRKKSTLL